MVEGKVAIISADKHVIGMLREPFAEANFQVESAQSGQEGLTLCRQFLPQVALVEVDLPDMSGFQVSRLLRSTVRTSHVHIVVLARTLDRQVRLEGLETGADDFIVVPFDPDEVRLRVRNALRRASGENLTDPVTGLPSGRLIQTRLRELVGRADGWALLGLSIRHLEPFKETHGFLAAQEVLRFAAQVLAKGVDQWGSADDFIGHNGGGRFVIVTAPSYVEALTNGLSEHFRREIQAHYTFDEREQGYVVVNVGDEERRVPLMALDVRQVLPGDGPFYDIRSLTEAMN